MEGEPGQRRGTGDQGPGDAETRGLGDSGAQRETGRGSPLLRLFRLWRIYAWMDLTWVTRDFRSFVVMVASDTIVNLTLVAATLLLAERFDGIGRWSKEQVLFMLGYALLTRGLIDTFFGFNIAFISRRIGRGQLDHLLVQPQPLWMAFLTDGFTPISGCTAVAPGVLLLLWAVPGLGLTVSADWLALLALNIISSIGIVLAFTFFWGSLAFWAPRGAEEISSAAMRLIDQLKSFPLDGVGSGLLGGLLTVVPVGFVAWYPARALLGLDPGPLGPFITPLAAVAFGGLTAWIYQKGVRHYGHTGSQRYHSMGHRR